jgi:hypothetical protein
VDSQYRKTWKFGNTKPGFLEKNGVLTYSVIYAFFDERFTNQTTPIEFWEIAKPGLHGNIVNFDEDDEATLTTSFVRDTNGEKSKSFFEYLTKTFLVEDNCAATLLGGKNLIATLLVSISSVPPALHSYCLLSQIMSHLFI